MSALLQRIMFNPPWWAVWLNPYFLSRRALYRAMGQACRSLSGRVLDVGCGVKPYRQLITNANEVVGLEFDTAENRASKQADAYYDGNTFPFPDGSFQGVVCNQVLEHVFNPERFLAEIHRVMAPGGRLVLSVPLVWPEHEQPWDCLRYTSFGLADRIVNAGFRIDYQEKLVGGGAAVCALMADRLNHRVRGLPVIIRVGVRFLVIGPVSLVGWGLGLLSRRDPDLYLDNFLVAYKPNDR